MRTLTISLLLLAVTATQTYSNSAPTMSPFHGEVVGAWTYFGYVNRVDISMTTLPDTVTVGDCNPVEIPIHIAEDFRLAYSFPEETNGSVEVCVTEPEHAHASSCHTFFVYEGVPEPAPPPLYDFYVPIEAKCVRGELHSVFMPAFYLADEHDGAK